MSISEADNQDVPSDRDGDDEEDDDDEIDIEKTKEGLWSLLTGQYQTVL